MISRITTFAFEGVEARPIDVQVQLSGGSNASNIVGLPDKAVGESRERVRAAIGAVPRDSLEGVAAIGELTLDDGLADTHGALPATMAAGLPVLQATQQPCPRRARLDARLSRPSRRAGALGVTSPAPQPRPTSSQRHRRRQAS